MAAARSRSGRTATAPPWVRYSNEKLLEMRLCDLDLEIAASPLEDRVEELYDDLARRGFRFRPHVWLSSDWFSPKGVPGIAIPFYLVHKRLQRLERTKMFECEGADRKECNRILRHECGHALQHAYRLHRRRRWQQLFGRSSKRYPEHYRPDPTSRRYVQHLRLYYAQSHPDEDFAETFAVWMAPRSKWRRRYAGWPALKKLEYVDELMEEVKEKAPLERSRRRVDDVSRLRTTLAEYYREKTELYAVGQPEVFDSDLRKLFSDDPRHADHQRASAFLRRHRAEIRNLVARWTGEYQYTLDQVLTDMIERCRELKLRAVGLERRLVMDFAVLVTVQTMRSHFDRRNWIAL
ncbi:MAG: putative zinc-binding metallopeptidase [Planctomycetota bacterium JB042]